MSSHKTYLYACAFIFITACSKKQFAPLPDPPDKPTNGLYDCDPAIPEYIHAEFNTLGICFNTVTNAADTFNNAYYRDSSIHLDHINLIRRNTKKTLILQLHFVNTDLHNKTLPYVLPHANPKYNEYAQIVISDLNKLWINNINEDYIGSTYKDFSITVTDTTGGYLSGTFKGEADTKHGGKIIIDNGTFYIHVIDVNKNN
jgi:hypothetical protein